ncbi:MAG: DNA-directed RNA polymerase subunit D [Sulfolobales archaeon]
MGSEDVKIKILTKTDDYIEALIEGVPLPILNALRRMIQLEVPTMAIDEVIFYDNTSPLYDEIIAHRLGLIPLRSEEALTRYRSPEECARCMESYYTEAPEESISRPSREECENCFTYIRASIDNKGRDLKIFYSKDLVSDDPYVKPVYEEIPIAVLGPDQRISFDAKARLGRGIEHIKWSPVSVAGVRYVAEISTNRVSEELYPRIEECVGSCPVNILEFSKTDGKIIVKDIYRCTLCMQCVKKCPEGSIKIGYRKDQYVLFLESVGQLSLKSIILTALDILISKIDHLIEQAENIR